MYGKDVHDCWVSDPLLSTLTKGIDANTTQFRHEIVLMALQLSHQQLSKIYLYNGARRRIKCERTETAVTIRFSDAEACNAWYRCTPPKLASIFDNIWKLERTERWAITFAKKEQPGSIKGYRC